MSCMIAEIYRYKEILKENMYKNGYPHESDSRVKQRILSGRRKALKADL